MANVNYNKTKKIKTMEKTLGGDRLGSGKKMKVELHGYERSTHDMSYPWRSTMAPGTLVPFLREVALPGDTFDIDLNVDVKTHPTIGPLFGSYKVQLDIFEAPIRLYQGQLHNNKLGIGMNMSQVKLPIIELTTPPTEEEAVPNDIDNSQINPSCILAYLGIRGVGQNHTVTAQTREFNAVPYLAYWDIYKNYYANKQEEIGAVLHKAIPIITETLVSVQYQHVTNTPINIPQEPASTTVPINYNAAKLLLAYSPDLPDLSTIMLNTSSGRVSVAEMISSVLSDDGSTATVIIDTPKWTETTIFSWGYITPEEGFFTVPEVVTFPLSSIDTMRERILAHSVETTPFSVNDQVLAPYQYAISNNGNGVPFSLVTQEGLALKTYQSDLFNNWLATEWIDGPNGISEITAVDTSGGSFTIDTLNLARKVYDLLNRVAVSGGTYDDWLDAVYTHDRYTRCESPIYHGGLIRELEFQEVISNSESTSGQPLGTLAGRGIMGQRKKGGGATIKVNEPSYIIGIISITPRIDYSQGNKWDVHLKTMDDLHKPQLDQIGFQELITEQMAWWDTKYNGITGWVQRSAGKQPAWMNYMTNVNMVLGNFAIKNNEMFMVLNRQYEYNETTGQIKDLTTYIDPAKYNNIFAQTSLDAQNFWVQIGVGMEVRRKMSAKIMPNL